MKRTIRLRESELKRMIAESVRKVLKEAADHKINYNGQEITLNADNQGSWYKLGDIRKNMAKQYRQKANAADAEVDRISDQEGYRKNPQLYQQYQNARNQVKQNNALANKYDNKAQRNNQNGYNIAKNDLQKLNQHLDKIVAESVKKVLNEGGHLYYKDEDGNVHTNSKETYRGVPGSVYISHGEWADAEILWDGVELNANDVEEGLWYSYKDDCEENGEQPTEQGYETWLEEMGTDYIASQLDDLAWAAQGCP